VFATSMYDAHAILMRGKVIERCRENLANIHCGRHVWRYCGLCRGLGAAACVREIALNINYRNILCLAEKLSVSWRTLNNSRPSLGVLIR